MQTAAPLTVTRPLSGTRAKQALAALLAAGAAATGVVVLASGDEPTAVPASVPASAPAYEGTFMHAHGAPALAPVSLSPQRYDRFR